MQAKAFIAYAAKAVAAFLAPFIMLGLVWLSTKAGIDSPVKFDELNTWLVAAVGALLQEIWVYYQKNASKVVSTEVTTTEVTVPKTDLGELVIGSWVWVVLLIVAFMLGYLWAGR